MNTNRFDPSLLALAVAVAFLIPVGTQAASKVTFDNISGKPALVKIAGPTASSVSVENGKKESVSVDPGHYYIKVRYGTPGAYAYSKGDEFDVTETATTASDITITLHKVVAGNYGSKTISEAEFGTDENTNKQESATSASSKTPAWVRIIQDKDFENVWVNAELAYKGARGLGMISPGEPHDMLGFDEDLMKFIRNGPLTPEALEKKHGSPYKTLKEGEVKWLDYGPIQFGIKGDGKLISRFRAEEAFYRYGFENVTTNTINKHTQPSEGK